MFNVKNAILAGVISLSFLGATNEALAANPDVKTFTNFDVTYSGAEKFAPFSLRDANTNAAVNLTNDTGTAWITATMKNDNDVYRGQTTLQRGDRKEFAPENAAVGFKYKLGLRKTNNTGGGSVTIKGSWSASVK